MRGPLTRTNVPLNMNDNSWPRVKIEENEFQKVLLSSNQRIYESNLKKW